MSKGGPKPALAYLAVAVVALIVRLGALAFVHPICPDGVKDPRHGCFVLTGDSEYVALQADALLEGHGFADAGRIQFGQGGRDAEGATHPPMYTLVMAAWQGIGLDGVHSWRVAMAVVGSIGALLLGMLAARLWELMLARTDAAAGADVPALSPAVVGVLAGLIAALSPLLWTRDMEVLVEALLVPLLAAYGFAALRLWSRPSVRSAAMVGAVVGVATLTRSEQFLLLGGLVPLMLRGHRELGWARRLGLIATTCGAAGLVVAPWSIYNLTRFENPVPLSTNGGLALLFGACDATYYGPSFAYYDWECVEAVEADPDLDPSTQDRERIRVALEYINSHTRRTAIVGLVRAARLWRIYDHVDTTRREAYQEKLGATGAWLNMVALLVTVPFAAWGASRLRRTGIPLGPLVAPAAIATLAALLLIPLPRFRAPADAMMVPLAAIGAADAWHSRYRSSGKSASQTGGEGQAIPVPEIPQ